MKKHIVKLLFVVPIFLLLQCTSKKDSNTKGYELKTITEDGYTYETVTNDPLGARIYTLKNGLKVYLTVFKEAPRIQTYIAVRAGSKNDPSTATGLAHYLEHLVFKGTSKIGTMNWEKEKVELDKIKELYQVYGATTDEAERKKIYKQIDSISYIAAGYAVANEYDKMISSIGGKGTNAYTSLDQTVYVNDIPSNQLERWIEIEAERFGELVPRLFHTELEAVYEEKNRSLDNDFFKVYEELYRLMFKNHTYGTQTTIGTIEHLKNPSIVEIEKYFYKYYVPNNMAICLSGDFDPKETIKAIDKFWGAKESKPVEQPTFEPEPDITEPMKSEVVGPSAEFLMMAYRIPGASTKEAMIADVFTSLLSNGTAGLMDLNLNQKMLVQSASLGVDKMNDFSIVRIYGQPKADQDLEDVKNLIIGQIDSVKQGKFDEEMLASIVNNLKIQRMKVYEENYSRADVFVNTFINNISWIDQVKYVDEMNKITKNDIVEFANKYFGNNYGYVLKKNGQDKVIKVDKPQITPVPVNRDTTSVYYTQVMSKQVPEIQPVFVDFKKELTEIELADRLPLIYKKNNINNLFNLYYTFDIGKDNDPKYALAVAYMNFIGTDKYSAEELKKEFFKIGCEFYTYSSDDKLYINISGLEENLEKAVSIFESLLVNPETDNDALSDVVQSILKDRADAKLSKATILRAGLGNYAKYGSKSSFTNILSEQELKAIKAEDAVSWIKELKNFEHKVLYYGAKPANEVAEIIKKAHPINGSLNPAPKAKDFPQLAMDKNQVLWTHYDMVQAEIMFMTKSVNYDNKVTPVATLFNEYFGGNMGSIVFQEMRESKALAYSASSFYSVANQLGKANYIVSYIGTQSDKLPEAMIGMQDLLNNIPKSEATFNNAKESVLKAMQTERITKDGVLFAYESAKKLGIDYDKRKDVYEFVKNATFADVLKFNEDYVKNKPQTIIVIGDKSRLNFKELSKYGPIKELRLEELFGY
jgi:predicted Zn-dependent peptidase